MYRTTLFPLALLALALTACGDDDDPLEPGAEASYEIQISGALSETARGRAFFGTDTDNGGQPIFGLLLGDDTTRHVIVAAKPGSTRPGTGSYTLVDPESDATGWQLLHVVSEGDEAIAVFYATGGTITITESSDDVLRGTITADLMGLMGEEMAEAELSATFVALPAEVSISASGAP